MTIILKTNTNEKITLPPGVTVLPLAEGEVKIVGKAPVMYQQYQAPAPAPAPASAPARAKRGYRGPSMLVVSTAAFLMLITGLTVAAILFNEYFKLDNSVLYRGTCTISSTRNNDMIVLNDNYPRSQWFFMPASEQVEQVEQEVAGDGDGAGSPVWRRLLEDMVIEDNRETIKVRDGWRSFEMIHDFDDRLTQIATVERCFILSMLESVVEPRALAAALRNASRLDLTHAHATLRAALPALASEAAAPAIPALAGPCLASRRPVYRLYIEDNVVLRKRSADAGSTPPPEPEPLYSEADMAPDASPPKEDFVQFSGRHLQRITITNMDDVLQYEIANNVLRAHPKLWAGATD